MWSTRGAKKYFYLMKRVDGRPKKIYLGSGFVAEAAAAEIEQRRQERKARAEAVATRETELKSAEEPLANLCDGLDEVVTAMMLAAGYHRHDRGTWRLRREQCKSPPNAALPTSDSAGTACDDCSGKRG
jgi:uncharacterized protein (DUF3084 family)